jgi:hypothetical protein
VEEELAARLGEGEVAQLIEDNEVEARQVVGLAALLATAGLSALASSDAACLRLGSSGSKSCAPSLKQPWEGRVLVGGVGGRAPSLWCSAARGRG